MAILEEVTILLILRSRQRRHHRWYVYATFVTVQRQLHIVQMWVIADLVY